MRTVTRRVIDMSIDESIAHEREVAKEIYVEAMLCHANPNDEKLDGCIERGKYHEQLAEWLEELKKRRSEDYGYMADIHQSIGYRKAIDDFAGRLIRYVDCGHLCSPTEMRWSDLSVVEMVKKLSEQLKAGGENES